MAWSVVLLVDFWWSPCNFVMSHFNVMLLKSQECMYVYVSIVVPIYLCMYACMRVCMYACMYACMHHVSMMIVCLVGHMRLPWVDGRWQPEPAGRKRAK